MNAPVASTGPGKILCVHQGAELYGSDRSFLQAVATLRAQYPNARIDVLLAEDGPLVDMLRQVSDAVKIRDLLVLRLANLPTTLFKCTIGLPYYVARAWRDGRNADLVYVNTSVIADYMLAARLAPRRHILHVREIPKARVMPVIRGFCRFSRAMILYNSRATDEAFALPASQKQAVIHNGSDLVGNVPPANLPSQFSSARPLRIAMLGRINNWKGQDLLIAAAALLPVDLRPLLKVRIVGSVYGSNQEPLDALHRQVAAAGLEDVVSIQPFQNDPSEVYASADVCAVPSRLPEPFGRVAIEAMAWRKPVIVSAHGGLVEIVENGRSGWYFPPNDAQALADVIASILKDPAMVRNRGDEALARFRQDFSTEAMSGNLRRIVSNWMRWR